MKKGTITGFILALLLVVFSSGALAENVRWVVSNVPASHDQFGAIVHKYEGTILKRLSWRNATVVDISRSGMERMALELDSQTTYEEDFIHRIAVEPQRRYFRIDRSKRGYMTPWGVARIRAPQTWTYSNGTGAKVCVVDTGVDPYHPDLKDKLTGGYNAVSQGMLFSDDNGHGTHVTGTILANGKSGIIGVAPGAELYSVKALNAEGSGYSSDLAEGIDACRLAGADVINMSWGSYQLSTIVKKAIDDAIAAGITMVAAAGNNSGRVTYPAALRGVLAVTAMDGNGRFATFSNFGPEVSTIAPGVAIPSTCNDSTYCYMSGTSMAAPHVAGVEAIRRGLGKTNLGVINLGMHPFYQGYGQIDAYQTFLLPY